MTPAPAGGGNGISSISVPLRIVLAEPHFYPSHLRPSAVVFPCDVPTDFAEDLKFW